MKQVLKIELVLDYVICEVNGDRIK